MSQASTRAVLGAHLCLALLACGSPAPTPDGGTGGSGVAQWRTVPSPTGDTIKGKVESDWSGDWQTLDWEGTRGK